MSSLPICSMACMTRPAFSGSLSAIISPSAFGTVVEPQEGDDLLHLDFLSAGLQAEQLAGRALHRFNDRRRVGVVSKYFDGVRQRAGAAAVVGSEHDSVFAQRVRQELQLAGIR